MACIGSGAKDEIGMDLGDSMSDEFNILWRKIGGYGGEDFKTRKGMLFTYRTEGDVLHTSRTNYQLTKSDFQKAYEMVPIKDPSELKGLVRGGPYIWAILNDPRISGGKW